MPLPFPLSSPSCFQPARHCLSLSCAPWARQTQGAMSTHSHMQPHVGTEPHTGTQNTHGQAQACTSTKRHVPRPLAATRICTHTHRHTRSDPATPGHSCDSCLEAVTTPQMPEHTSPTVSSQSDRLRQILPQVASVPGVACQDKEARGMQRHPPAPICCGQENPMPYLPYAGGGFRASKLRPGLSEALPGILQLPQTRPTLGTAWLPVS